MGMNDLDPAVPHPIMLLGKRMVLWRDARQIWRCLDDCCSHRCGTRCGAHHPLQMFGPPELPLLLPAC